MITAAKIYVSHYKRTLEFYKELLPSSTSEKEKGVFQLTFKHNALTLAENQTSEVPYYHFAFLIPWEVFDEVKRYAASKVTLNREKGKDEISFVPGIRSFYFYDPSGNVVEFIAKEKLDLPFKDDFSEQSIYCLTEMSLVTDQLTKTSKDLVSAGLLDSVDNVRHDSLTFIPSGETILLLSPVGRTWVFSNKKAKVFPQEIMMDGVSIVVDENKQITVSKP